MVAQSRTTARYLDHLGARDASRMCIWPMVICDKAHSRDSAPASDQPRHNLVVMPSTISNTRTYALRRLLFCHSAWVSRRCACGLRSSPNSKEAMLGRRVIAYAHALNRACPTIRPQRVVVTSHLGLATACFPIALLSSQ